MEDLGVTAKSSREISKCSPEVWDIITKANSLPEDFNLLEQPPHDTFELQPKRGVELQREIFNDAVKSIPNSFIVANEWLRKIINGESFSFNNPPADQEYIIKKIAEEYSVSEIGDTWREFYVDDKHILHQSAPVFALYNDLRWAITARGGLQTITEINNRVKSAPDVLRHITIFNKQGVLTVHTHYPIDILINEKTDTRRIQLCQKCNNFFWLKRLDKRNESEACDSCSNAVRQKRFKEKNREKVREQRRMNYYQEKGVPFCEKCIRPTTKCDCYAVERQSRKQV